MRKMKKILQTNLIKQYLLIYLSLILLTGYLTKNTKVQLTSSEKDIARLSFQAKNSGYNLDNINNGTVKLSTSNGDEIMNINSYKSIDFATPVKINTESLDLVMDFANSHLLYDDVAQWTMIKFEDFQGVAEGWSKEKLSTCGTNDNMFLGGHCNFGGEEVGKNFTGIPKHTQIRITANFHFFDRWEGEEAFMYFDGHPVWADSYKWCDKVFLWYCKKYSINACGAEYPDRLSVPIDFSSKKNKNIIGWVKFF
jgi:hypothetical protein